MIRKVILSVFGLLLMSNFSYASKRILVDISKQRAYALENGRVVFSGRVSTGKPGHRTPTGYFRVLRKDINHVSSKYPEPNGGAKMHYMLGVTSSGIAMHLGYVPNYPASHGCIRMENGFAQRMFYWANVGTPIRIAGSASIGDYTVRSASSIIRSNTNRLSALEALGFRHISHYTRSHKRRVSKRHHHRKRISHKRRHHRYKKYAKR